MRVRLRRIFGEGIDDDTVVATPTFLIGRSTDCGLRPTCPLVSRNHCELIVRDDYVAVRDLNSKNGTWVNDEPVVSERQLFSGDQLRLGMCFLEVFIERATDHKCRIAGWKAVLSNDRATVASDAPARLPACTVGCA